MLGMTGSEGFAVTTKGEHTPIQQTMFCEVNWGFVEEKD